MAMTNVTLQSPFQQLLLNFQLQADIDYEALASTWHPSCRLQGSQPTADATFVLEVTWHMQLLKSLRIAVLWATFASAIFT